MTRRGRLHRLMLGVVAALAIWLVASLLVVGRSMRRGRPRFDEPEPPRLAGRVESLRIATQDGEDLGAWYLEEQRNDAPSVLLLHGRGCTRGSRLAASQVFESDGCAVLLITHRAHGDSSGERDDFGWSAKLDVVAAVEWLEVRRPRAPIVVCGESFGAAAATFAAGELGERVDGYVLEGLYRDLDSAARSLAETRLPPIVDWFAYTGMRLAGEILLPEWREIAPIEAVAEIPQQVPVLLLAGSLDRRAPLADARALHARIADHAELIPLQAEHGRLPATRGYGAATNRNGFGP